MKTNWELIEIYSSLAMALWRRRPYTLHASCFWVIWFVNSLMDQSLHSSPRFFIFTTKWLRISLSSLLIFLTFHAWKRLDFLNVLPEPLLGYDNYNAILACEDVEILSDRVRNLALLFQETSWYNKPLLYKVLVLFHDCCKSENAKFNGLNIVALAVLTTPSLIRCVSLPTHYRFWKS